MSLDGLRAWIGEVERKLGMRTRVFLVLTVIAIGVGGAAIYLAIDARDSSVSESDVQALQEQLEARIDEGGGYAPGATSTQLEAELKALQAEVAELKGGGDKSQSGGEKEGADSGSGTSEQPSGGSGDKPAGSASDGATGGAPSAAKLQELFEQAKERAEEAE